MGRLSGWELRLTAHVAEHLERPFCWGSNDCFTFPSGAEFALTGRRSFQEIIAEYNDARSAMRALERRGWSGCGDAADEIFAALPPPLAGRGDFATIPTTRGADALGVVVGDRVAVVGLRGLEFHSLLRATRAWRVE